MTIWGAAEPIRKRHARSERLWAADAYGTRRNDARLQRSGRVDACIASIEIGKIKRHTEHDQARFHQMHD